MGNEQHANADANHIFYRYAPFVQEFIYRHGWDELREVQTEAARVLFETDDNLLLSSATASGKTEAAFFPILTMLYEMPPQSVGALYIAPLKSLINDQFGRMEEVIEDSGVPVYHWHGDVASSHKNKVLNHPRGILQITPESLESLLMNRSNDVVRLFGDLRFVVIDEIHVLTGADRGNQIRCELERIAHLIGHHPRRVGLSATVGDLSKAAAWLGANTGRNTQAPAPPRGGVKWRLAVEHFYVENDMFDQTVETRTSPPRLQNTPSRSVQSGENPAIDVTQKGIEGFSDAMQQEKTAPVTSRQAAAMTVSNVSQDETSKMHAAPATAALTSSADPSAPILSHAMIDAGYEYIYAAVKGRKALVFSNSREETEFVTATLRQIARNRGEEDVFLIHHGNLSAAIREDAEEQMRMDERQVVTCATVTLELGVDIGRLERVVQIGAPSTICSLLQRLGRSGRRGGTPEMFMVFREENATPETPLPQRIPWDLLRGCAMLQLYLEQRFLEPPAEKKMPLSLLFQQTLSVLSAAGELTPKQLAQRVLPMAPFVHVTREDYRTLLFSMIQNDFLEMTEEKTLIIGLKGERLTSNFRFYAVFRDQDTDYSVRCGAEEIGTITSPPPVGDRFALAGNVWEVEELDLDRKLIYVHRVAGKMEISWPGDFGEVHTKILERMRQVLLEDTIYPYLKQNAVQRLKSARNLFANAGGAASLLCLGGMTWCLFPWLGTRSFRTLRKFLQHHAAQFGISRLEYEGCYYMMFKMERATGEELICALNEILQREGLDCAELVAGSEIPIFEKYDPYIPQDLLRRAYAADRLRADELIPRVAQIAHAMQQNHTKEQIG